MLGMMARSIAIETAFRRGCSKPARLCEVKKGAYICIGRGPVLLETEREFGMASYSLAPGYSGRHNLRSGVGFVSTLVEPPFLMAQRQKKKKKVEE